MHTPVHRTFARPFRFAMLALAVLLTGPIIGAGADTAPAPAEAPAPATQPASTVRHPAWSDNLSIYEVNIRQYSPGGTFKEFQAHLPRLQEMGVGILWLMPIHPIGEVNRKGSLGSHYAVRDYRKVNPDYGTLDDLKALVDEAHERGMYVILDWVPNHTAWDNPLTQEHPDWYTKDENGNFTPPVPDWADVIDLNYDSPGLRRYMLDALAYWVREAGIDGYRVDVAGMVPLDFWAQARAELGRIKPVFLLAEWDAPEAHEHAYDMTYSWGLSGVLTQIARGEKTIDDLDGYLRNEAEHFGPDAIRMYYTSNHDENSWNGSAAERMGDAVPVMVVLAATLREMPLVYNGQEAGLDRRLSFFDKDLIEWREHPMTGLYTALLNLKKTNKALLNGDLGGGVVRVRTCDDQAVFAFTRSRDGDGVLVITNLTDQPKRITLTGDSFVGEYTDVFTGEAASLTEGAELTLEPWGYRVLVR